MKTIARTIDGTPWAVEVGTAPAGTGPRVVIRVANPGLAERLESSIAAELESFLRDATAPPEGSVVTIEVTRQTGRQLPALVEAAIAAGARGVQLYCPRPLTARAQARLFALLERYRGKGPVRVILDSRSDANAVFLV